MDWLYLTRGPSTVNIGSYLRADPGADYGEKDLLRPVYSENSRTEGGFLRFETVGVRRMSFPLLLPSGGAGLTLAGLEEVLRELARPGATLDVKPEYVPTGDMVRFDVLAGRWEAEHQVRHWEYGRKLGTLRLDVDPFGYLPTWITLASAASVGLPGYLTVPGGSVLGDAPGLVRLTVQPTHVPTSVPPAGTWLPDVLAWSLAPAHPSFLPFLGGGSWGSGLTSPAYSNSAQLHPIAATVLIAPIAGGMVGFTQIAYYDIATALEPAYRGVFRAYLYGGHETYDTQTTHGEFLLDAVSLGNPSGPMASANVHATYFQAPATGAAPALLDLGQLTIPPAASGLPQGARLRLWYGNPTGLPSVDPVVNGLLLLPLTQAGVQQQGIAWPDFRTGRTGKWQIDSSDQTVLIAAATHNLATQAFVQDGVRWHRGGFPKITPSHTMLTLAGACRRTQSASAYRSEILRASPLCAWSLDQTSGTIVDYGPNGIHGVANASRGAPPGFDAQATNLAHYYNGLTRDAAGSHSAIIFNARSFTVELIARRDDLQSGSIDEHVWNHGTAVSASGGAVQVGFRSDNHGTNPGGVFFGFAGNDLDVIKPGLGLDGQWHHYVFVYDSQAVNRTIYMDGSMIGSAAAGTHYGGAESIFRLGAREGGNNPFKGSVDELVVYRDLALPANRVRAHYQAAFGDPNLRTRPGPLYATASVQYRPRFTFLKGGV